MYNPMSARTVVHDQPQLRLWSRYAPLYLRYRHDGIPSLGQRSTHGIIVALGARGAMSDIGKDTVCFSPFAGDVGRVILNVREADVDE